MPVGVRGEYDGRLGARAEYRPATTRETNANPIARGEADRLSGREAEYSTIREKSPKRMARCVEQHLGIGRRTAGA